MTKKHNLMHPRHWLSWLGMGLGWFIGILPFRLQMAIGRGLGNIAYYLVPSRRNVAAINLQMCFPEYTAEQRHALLRAHFRSVGMGAVEAMLCWWGSAAKVESLYRLEGLEHLQHAASSGQGFILLSAHFTSLELGARMAKLHLDRLGVFTNGMYKPPHDPVLDYVMQRRREHHIGEASIRHDQVKTLVRALRNKRAVWYAADQRASEQAGVMVPFFGHMARTHVATTRLANMGKALVVPFFTIRNSDNSGYKLIAHPALENFPSGDEVADAQRINKIIEEVARTVPEQYFWLHKRFQSKDFDPYTEEPNPAK